MARIILIEPDRILVKQYSYFLGQAGHIVQCCYGAQEALVYADKKCPDMVVSELLLPGHSGIEFLYEFRSYSDWQQVPVVVLTRLPRNELPVTDAALRELGVAAYLYKAETSLKRLGQCVGAILPAGQRA